MTGRRRALALVGGLTAPMLLAPAAMATSLKVDIDLDRLLRGDREVRVTSTTDGGKGSLRQAINDANDRRGATTIELKDATYTLSIAGPGENAGETGDLDVTSRITIDGNGATIDAATLDRVLDVRAGATLALEDVTLTGGAPPATESGGAVRSVAKLHLKGVRVTGNVVTGMGASGGAIINDGGELYVERSTLDRNSATRAGGAVEASGRSRSTFVRARLLANATGPGPGNGGAVHITGAGTVVVERSIVQRNTAAAEGGGLWNSADGRLHVDRSVVRFNTASGVAADQGGGGIFSDGGSTTVNRSWISRNIADGTAGSGGGILNNGGTLVVVRTKITRNASQRAGGGVEAVAGTTRFYRARLTANATGAAPGNGGGFHQTGAGEVSVVRTSVRGNTAALEGGGLWNSAAGRMTVHRSTIAGNTASGPAADDGGGGLFNDGGTLTVVASVVSDNVADGASGSGGGILNNMGTLRVEHTEIDDNSSVRAGGGIEASAGTTILRDVDLVDNDTGPTPGNGGGLHLTGAGRVEIRDGSVLVNSAALEGGGLWNSATGTMIVTGTEISDNEAPTGPNVFNDGGTFVIDGDPVPVGP